MNLKFEALEKKVKVFLFLMWNWINDFSLYLDVLTLLNVEKYPVTLLTTKNIGAGGYGNDNVVK